MGQIIVRHRGGVVWRLHRNQKRDQVDHEKLDSGKKKSETRGL
jgi:hypothetical protein